MMRIIKRVFYPAVAAFILGLTVLLTFSGRDDINLKSFRSGNGWGYSISMTYRSIIKQPYLPAIYEILFAITSAALMPSTADDTMPPA